MASYFSFLNNCSLANCSFNIFYFSTASRLSFSIFLISFSLLILTSICIYIYRCCFILFYSSCNCFSSLYFSCSFCYFFMAILSAMSFFIFYFISFRILYSSYFRFFLFVYFSCSSASILVMIYFLSSYTISLLFLPKYLFEGKPYLLFVYLFI